MTDVAERFTTDGYCFPLEVLAPDAALALGDELLRIHADERVSTLGNKGQFNYTHVVSRAAADLIRHPTLLDAAESILGPDLLVWGSTLFTKAPHSESYVSWHQDLQYWGLDSDAEVAAWIALGPVTEASGCMRFVPGSHLGDPVAHIDTFDADNALTRGQEADVVIDPDDTVLVELEPGQASLHHGRLLHASGPNRTDGWRLGLTVNYIAPHMRQAVAATDFAVLVRGEDRFGHFEHVPAPEADLSDESLAWHRRILKAQNDAMYEGVEDAEGKVV
jgi:hypothetical protein